MQVALGQRQAFAKGSGMFDDAQNGAMRAVPSQAAAAPLAGPESQVDLTYDPAADPFAGIGVQHLAHEFMARRAGEAVISALQFQVGIADAAAEEPDQRESLGTSGARLVAHLDAPVFQVYDQHGYRQSPAHR